MSKAPSIAIGSSLSVAFETNGRGYLGFIAELPGAYVRGKTEHEALTKIGNEANCFLKWLDIDTRRSFSVDVCQRHSCSLMIEDADSEILLDADRVPISEEEFNSLVNLVNYSGETFSKVYINAGFKDWADPAKIRKTFYGECPRTIREIFDHVRRTQYYYLSRTKATFDKREEDFTQIREFCIDKLNKLFQTRKNLVYEADNELWTIKKILRRLVWHDRIHGKAIIRILEKQKHLGMIDKYTDPFRFIL